MFVCLDHLNMVEQWVGRNISPCMTFLSHSQDETQG